MAEQTVELGFGLGYLSVVLLHTWACLCAEADRVLYAPSMAQPTRRYHLPSAMRVSPARIDPPAARALLARDAILVDVRRQDDASAAVAGAVRIPPDEIPARLGELSRGVPIVLVCT